MTDGDVEIQRFDKDDLEKAFQAIKDMRDRYRAILSGTVSTPVATMAGLSGLLAVTPAYDPVTNTGGT